MKWVKHALLRKIQVKLNTTQISAWLVCRNFSRINFSRVWTLFPWNLITRKIFTLHRIIHLACLFLCNLLFFIVMISSLGAFALGAILQKSLYAHWKKKTGSWSKEGFILCTWIKKGKFLIKRNWSYWDEISQWTFHEAALLVHCLLVELEFERLIFVDGGKLKDPVKNC